MWSTNSNENSKIVLNTSKPQICVCFFSRQKKSKLFSQFKCLNFFQLLFSSLKQQKFLPFFFVHKPPFFFNLKKFPSFFCLSAKLVRKWHIQKNYHVSTFWGANRDHVSSHLLRDCCFTKLSYFNLYNILPKLKKILI